MNANFMLGISAEMIKEIVRGEIQPLGALITPLVEIVSNRLLNAYSPSVISGSRDHRFRETLKNHFSYTSNYIKCMVTGKLGNGEEVCAAHILPSSTNEDIYSRLGMT